MILAEKITELRKKNGWSQEELAEQLDVSRQSISKWESAQSVPDMSRILKMSELFGVSTDLLLKDNLELTEDHVLAPVETTEEYGVVRAVSMEEADVYSVTGASDGFSRTNGGRDGFTVRKCSYGDWIDCPASPGRKRGRYFCPGRSSWTAL